MLLFILQKASGARAPEATVAHLHAAICQRDDRSRESVLFR